MILPQETASSGLAPLSDPSKSLDVFTNTLKSAPLRWKSRHEVSVESQVHFIVETSKANDLPLVLGSRERNVEGSLAQRF